MKHDLPPFALLIDADNVSKDAIAPILGEITRHARLTVKRVYGDFTTTNLGGWRETLADHGIHPIQQYRNSTGKNASDSALIIDAMDLLHSRRFEGFALVSSDGDFTRLATRIREDGLTVYGFGRTDAARAFVQACDSYIFIESLLNPPGLPSSDGNPAPNPATPKSNLPPTSKPATSKSDAPPASKQAKQKTSVDLKTLVMRAYTKVADEDGWALVSRVEQYLRANHSELNPSNYGATTFFKLLSGLDTFRVSQRKQGNGHAQFCRPKQAEQKTTPVAMLIQHDPSPRQLPQPYIEAIKAAVAETRNTDHWAKIADIRAYLHQNGHKLENSGFSSLAEAIRATGQFDMCDAGGTNKMFRLAIQQSLP
ncbi:NYN domain-containing protein [Dechloromonas denitrificans]|uniref:NYN domain-containing protein n=1 Tax=Dechloromonas denitrificans TaxID=281362 RepID=UPI001CFBB2DC|nr:NYN domain-containing protein [Dechloromonas denitrificans]UCV08084.1 NYN domain-containing protein [Dechloromonas denitrificans]